MRRHPPFLSCGNTLCRFKRMIVWVAVATVCSVTAGGVVHAEVFSMQASKMPLESVLHDLSQKSGVTFVYDKAWANFPITVQFKNLPLEPALKKIFSNLSHAIIYNTDGTIIIRIYESGKNDIEPVAGQIGARSNVEESALNRPEQEDKAEQSEATVEEAAEEAAEEGGSGEEIVEAPEKEEAPSSSDEATEQEDSQSDSSETENPQSEESGGQEEVRPAEEG